MLHLLQRLVSGTTRDGLATCSSNSISHTNSSSSSMPTTPCKIRTKAVCGSSELSRRDNSSTSSSSRVTHGLAFSKDKSRILGPASSKGDSRRTHGLTLEVASSSVRNSSMTHMLAASNNPGKILYLTVCLILRQIQLTS